MNRRDRDAETILDGKKDAGRFNLAGRLDEAKLKRPLTFELSKVLRDLTLQPFARIGPANLKERFAKISQPNH